MAMAPLACGGLDAKHYTLAALAATLVLGAVVTIVSVVLTPAHISFSVTEARKDLTSYPARLVLTLTAHNPSRRARVRYQGIFVDVSNDTSLLWIAQPDDTTGMNWISADVSAHLPLDQQRCNETKVNATVVGLTMADGFITSDAQRFRVMVTAVARFKHVGAKWSKLYEINFSCGHVGLFGNESKRGDDCQQLVDT